MSKKPVLSTTTTRNGGNSQLLDPIIDMQQYPPPNDTQTQIEFDAMVRRCYQNIYPTLQQINQKQTSLCWGLVGMGYVHAILFIGIFVWMAVKSYFPTVAPSQLGILICPPLGIYFLLMGGFNGNYNSYVYGSISGVRRAAEGFLCIFAIVYSISQGLFTWSWCDPTSPMYTGNQSIEIACTTDYTTVVISFVIALVVIAATVITFGIDFGLYGKTREWTRLYETTVIPDNRLAHHPRENNPDLENRKQIYTPEVMHAALERMNGVEATSRKGTPGMIGVARVGYREPEDYNARIDELIAANNKKRERLSSSAVGGKQ